MDMVYGVDVDLVHQRCEYGSIKVMIEQVQTWQDKRVDADRHWCRRGGTKQWSENVSCASS